MNQERKHAGTFYKTIKNYYVLIKPHRPSQNHDYASGARACFMVDFHYCNKVFYFANIS